MHNRILLTAFIALCLVIFTGCTKSITTPPATEFPSDQQSSNSTEVAEAQQVGVLSETMAVDEVLPQSPLQIVVDQPMEGQTFNENEITIIGRTAPQAVVTVNDQIIVADEKGRFEIQMVLQNGFQVIEIEASNSLGEDQITELTVDIESD